MILYAADIHLSNHQPANRVDYTEEVALCKLDWILNRAKELNATVVLGGDIFEFPRPAYDFLNKVMDIFRKYSVPVYTAIGNHDIVMAQTENENAAIFTLFKSGLVKQLSKEPLIDDESGLFIVASDYSRDQIPTEYLFSNYPYDIPAGYKKVLVVHNSLIDEVPTNANGDALFNCVTLNDFKTDANLVLCGHIHKHWAKKIGSTTFISPGPICRLTIKERDLKPRVYILGKGTLKTEELPLKNPGEFVVSSKEKLKEKIGEIANTQIEANQIEDEINKSNYKSQTKEHGLLRVYTSREAAINI